MLTVILSLLFFEACRKLNTDAVVNPPPPPELPEQPPALTSTYGAYPVPEINAPGGLVGAAHVFISNGPGTFETRAGFGGFVKNGTRDQLVYGGQVTIDTVAIDTLHTGRGVVYARPNHRNALDPVNLPFTGNTAVQYSVGGNPAEQVAPFSDMLILPVMSRITSVSGGDSLSRTADLVIEWNELTPGDSVLVVAADNDGRVVIRLAASVTGSVRLPASELGSFVMGSGAVGVVKFRYRLSDHGGKTYAVLGETVHSLIVRWK